MAVGHALGVSAVEDAGSPIGDFRSEAARRARETRSARSPLVEEDRMAVLALFAARPDGGQPSAALSTRSCGASDSGPATAIDVAVAASFSPASWSSRMSVVMPGPSASWRRMLKPLPTPRQTRSFVLVAPRRGLRVAISLGIGEPSSAEPCSAAARPANRQPMLCQSASFQW